VGRNITSFILLVLLTWLAWTSWQPPAVIPDTQPVSLAIPEPLDAAPTLWRVVTRRMVWKEAAEAMYKRLKEAGLRVTSVTRKEKIDLHAFDDARTFVQRKDATQARKKWEKRGFEADVIHQDDHFGVGLGRFFLAAYARQMQKKLKKNGMKYSYERRMVNIPTWRFTFPAASHAKARKLWQRIQALGVADPSLMPEKQFESLFGK